MRITHQTVRAKREILFSSRGLITAMADEPKREKRDSIMPQSVSGWSALVGIATLAAGIILIVLKERDAGLLLIGGSGWSGFAALAARK